MPNTTRGRVVYERKPHLFTYRDVFRIAQKVEINPTSETKLADVGFALAAAQAALSDFYKAIRHLVPDERAFWVNRAFLQIMSEILNIVSLSTARGGRALQRLVDSIAERL